MTEREQVREILMPDFATLEFANDVLYDFAVCLLPTQNEKEVEVFNAIELVNTYLADLLHGVSEDGDLEE